MRRVSAAAPRPEMLLSLVMLGLSATAIVQIWDAPLRARQFPLLIAVPMLLLALYQLATDLRRGHPPDRPGRPPGPLHASDQQVRHHPLCHSERSEESHPDHHEILRSAQHDNPELDASVVRRNQSEGGGWRAIVWFVGFFAGVLALGFQPAIPLYTFLYLRVAARERLATSLALALAAWGAFQLLFVRLLHLPLFPGWLFQALGLD